MTRRSITQAQDSWFMNAPATRSVLVVEDDPDVRRAVSNGLTLNDFEVRAAASAEAARAALATEQPDVIVLDVGLPGASGIDLCGELRAQEIDVPILILSARSSVGDRVAGLQAGADDYLVKPFDLVELVARLEALLRRSGIGSQPPRSRDLLTVGGLTVDVERRAATTADCRLELTRREFDVLAAFATNQGIVLSRMRLLELVWGYDFEVDTNVVDVFVSSLRKKMAAARLPKMIQTVRGVGFTMDASQ